MPSTPRRCANGTGPAPTRQSRSTPFGTCRLTTVGKLNDSIQASLNPGETLRVSRAVATAGSGAGWTREGLILGVGGQSLADAGSDRHGSIRLDRRTNLLAITDQRVILGRTQFGKFKQILTDVPRAAVSAVSGEKAKLAIGKLTLHLTTGEQVVLDLASDRHLDEFLADAELALQP